MPFKDYLRKSIKVHKEKGLVTLDALAVETRIPRRTLYRWRERGVFFPDKIVSASEVYYKRLETVRLIRLYNRYLVDRFGSRDPKAVREKLGLRKRPRVNTG